MSLRQLLIDAGQVAMRDADAMYDQYAWPPKPHLTGDDLREAQRLEALAKRLWYRAHCLPKETDDE